MNRIFLLFAVNLLMLSSVGASAQWRDDLNVFRVGIAAGRNVADTSAAVEPFRLSLEEALGVPVEIFAARDYTSLVDANLDSRIEYSVMSATAYAATWNLCECVEPLVTASTADGATGFRSVIVTKADGPASPERLRGRVLAVLDSGAVGSELVGLHELAEAGLTGGDNPIIVKRFENSETAFAALADGSADAFLGWSLPAAAGNGTGSDGTVDLLSLLYPDGAGYTIIWQSSEIPLRVHVMRASLPAEAKTILRSHLDGLYSGDPVAYDSIEPIHGGGFLAARQSQFSAIKAALVARGIDADRPSKMKDPAETGSTSE